MPLNLMFLKCVNMKKLENLLFLTVSVLGVTLIISFSLAYLYNHVTYFLPYISDSGALPPESGYFGLGMNLLWILLSTIMYIKYLQVDYIVLNKDMNNNVECLNLWTFKVGLLAAFGAALVGNFQETTMFTIHWIGATMVITIHTVYLSMQTIIYFKLRDIFQQPKRTYVRAAISVISVISSINFVCAGLVAIKQFKGEDMLRWKQEDGAFALHQSSTISEWISALCIAIYYLMYYWEFKSISLSRPSIVVQMP